MRRRDGAGERGELTPPAIEAAIELARSAADPAIRRDTWLTLAQTGDPVVAQPMTDALLYDVDAEARGAAAEGLFYYRTDPVVRAALESASITDASLDVRLRARWSSLAYEDRDDYVRTALLDPSLTPEEKVAPLIYARSPRDGDIYSNTIEAEIPAIDGEALNALAGIAATSDNRASRVAALTELGLGGHQEFLPLLLAETDNRLLNEVVINLANRAGMPGMRFERQVLDALEPVNTARSVVERVAAVISVARETVGELP